MKPDDADRTGVYIGSGIGGFEVIEREHRILLEKGPSSHFAVFHSGDHRESGVGLCFDSHRRQRTELRHRHRLHHRRARDWRFVPDYSATATRT